MSGNEVDAGSGGDAERLAGEKMIMPPRSYFGKAPPVSTDEPDAVDFARMQTGTYPKMG